MSCSGVFRHLEAWLTDIHLPAAVSRAGACGAEWFLSDTRRRTRTQIARHPYSRVCQKPLCRKCGLHCLSKRELVTNSSPKIGHSRAVFVGCENGKARQLKGFRLLTSKLAR